MSAKREGVALGYAGWERRRRWVGPKGRRAGRGVAPKRRCLMWARLLRLAALRLKKRLKKRLAIFQKPKKCN